jgi:flavin-dependent thymidylate synthase
MSQIKVELLDFFGTDRSICESAWVSTYDRYKATTKTDQDVENLVKRLAQDGHGVPFESVVLRFWIRMPIATDRQFQTHRLQSSNGLSGRYRTVPSEYLNMQQDVVDIMDRFMDEYSKYNYEDEYNMICEQANWFYKDLIKQAKQAETEQKITNKEYKRLREFFRGMLPQHNMTERMSTMNLRSFANFQKLRNSPNAQEEIQEVSRLMLQEVKNKNVSPLAISELEKLKWII